MEGAGVGRRRRKASAEPIKTGLLERVRVPMFMVVFAGVLAITLASPGLEELRTESGDRAALLRQIGFPVLAVLALLAINLRQPRRLLTIPMPMLVALGWCWFSLSWSIEPQVSLTRLLLTSLVIWLVFTSVDQLGVQQSLTIARIMLTIALLVSFLAVLAIPEVATTVNYRGLWRGLLGDKNRAGATAALTVLLWILEARGRQRLFGVPVALVALLFLFNTGSRTAGIMVVVAGAVGGGIRLATPALRSLSPSVRQLYSRSFSALAAVLIVMLCYFSFNSEALLDLVADPRMLSLRGDIWQAMIPIYQKNIWSGTGFGAFWTTHAASDYGGSWLRNVTQGHNGYLDIALQVGLPGLLLVLLAVVLFPLHDLGRLARRDSETTAALAALFVFCLGSNITESALFDRDRLWWVFLLLSMAALRPALRRYRRSQRRVSNGGTTRGTGLPS